MRWTVALFVLAGALLIAALTVRRAPVSYPLAELVRMCEHGWVDEVKVTFAGEGRRARFDAVTTNGRTATALGEASDAVLSRLQESRARVELPGCTIRGFWSGVLATWTPVLLAFAALWIARPR